MSGPTDYPAANALLADLLAPMQAILGADLVGLYLDGSLALGDFDPASSDVDFIAAIARPLTPAQFTALAEMHRQMRTSGRPLATEVEGSYIPLAALRHHDPADATFANLERGPDEALKVKEHHSDWVIHRAIVREHGVALFGPPAATLIDPVTAGDVRRATAGVLRSWWATAEAAAFIRAAPPVALAVYVVPTMCRALYALEYGAVISKPAAGRWALATLDGRWRTLVERAQRGQLDEAAKEEVLAFVRAVAEGPWATSADAG